MYHYKSITLNSFTVPAGHGLNLNLAPGTRVTMSKYLSVLSSAPEILVQFDSGI